jgi:hypothetical protein
MKKYAVEEFETQTKDGKTYWAVVCMEIEPAGPTYWITELRRVFSDGTLGMKLNPRDWHCLDIAEDLLAQAERYDWSPYLDPEGLD